MLLNCIMFSINFNMKKKSDEHDIIECELNG